MNIRFRTAKKGDIAVIQDLSKRIWHEYYPGIISPAQIEYMLEKMYAADVVRKEIEQGYRYVLVSSEGTDIGYLSFRYDDKAASILLSKIYLLPLCHGKGIGRRMLDHVKHEAQRRGAETIILFVNKNNVRAIRAYKRFGFMKAEAIVTDIGKGFAMDDYRMELKI